MVMITSEYRFLGSDLKENLGDLGYELQEGGRIRPRNVPENYPNHRSLDVPLIVACHFPEYGYNYLSLLYPDREDMQEHNRNFVENLGNLIISTET